MLNRPGDTAEPASDRRARQRADLVAFHQPEVEVGGLSIAALATMVRRRKFALLLCALIIPILAWVGLQQVTPRYTAIATVMFEPQDYRANELQSILRDDPTTDAVLASQVEIIRSRAIAERVGDELDLSKRPEFNWYIREPSGLGGWLSRTRRFLGDGVARVFPGTAPWFEQEPEQAPSAEAVRESMIQTVRDAITPRVLRGSRVIEIGFISESPQIAARAANLVANLYAADQLEMKFDAVRRANEWLENRIAQLRGEVTQAEEKIARFRAESGLVQGVSSVLTTEQLQQLNADLLSARNDLALAEARVGQARGRNAGATVTANQSGTVQALRLQQATLRAELQRLRAQLGPNHPDVRRVQGQLNEISGALGGEIGRAVSVAETDVRAARERVRILEETLRTTSQQIEQNAEAEIPLRALEREADAARNLFQAVLARSQQIAQQTAIEKPDARTLSPAIPPGQPSSPKTLIIMAGAIVGGIAFGLLVVYLLEMVDSSFRSGEDVRTVLGLPCFALVPQIKRGLLGRMRVEDYVARKPLSPFAEGMRALRAGLWLGAEHPRVIAITAARPGEGKTITAIALGRSAAMNGERVCVLDCDIRQPSFGRLMRAEGAQGIVDCLLGNARAEDVIRKDWLTSMDFIPAGAAETHSLGLFMSDAMTKLLDRLRDDYDLILLDAPPAFAMADARVVARLADATLLCVRWRDTPRSVVRNSLELLEDAKAHVVGAALTRVDAKVHSRSGFADAEVYHPRYGAYFRE